VAPVSTDELFDLGPAVGGQRSEDFMFELLDDNKNPIGILDVNETPTPPTINFDTSRSTMRTCSGLQIDATDLSQIDPLRDRVRARVILQNGERPSLGVFMLGTDNRVRRVGSAGWKPDLFDEGFLLSQQLNQQRGVAPGGSIRALLESLLNEVGIHLQPGGVADQPASGAITFPATSNRIDAVNALASALGSFPPYINNDGLCYLKPVPGDGAGPDLVYEFGGRILEGTPTETNSSYKAPNEYIVTNGDPTNPVVGVYDLPAAAPNSAVRTGSVVTNTSTYQGITSAIANDVAKAVALTDTTTYTTATFSSLLDARHDGFSIVQLLGKLYLETGFSIACSPGGVMTHTLTGIYA